MKSRSWHRFGAALEVEIQRIGFNLGAEWVYSRGSAAGYGSDRMDYVGLRSDVHRTDVRVWWAGAEVRVSAMLGVPYEASDEVITSSTELIGEIVHALCSGDFVRREGRVEVRTRRGRVHLTEWSAYPVDMDDPWSATPSGGG